MSLLHRLEDKSFFPIPTFANYCDANPVFDLQNSLKPYISIFYMLHI